MSGNHNFNYLAWRVVDPSNSWLITLRREQETRWRECAPNLQRFDRVAKLIDGFETPYGMELLATVYWVAQREGASNFREVRDAMYGWSERKRQFASEEIKLAYRTLIERGWLNAKMPPLIVPRSISDPNAGSRLSK